MKSASSSLLTSKRSIFIRQEVLIQCMVIQAMALHLVVVVTSASPTTATPTLNHIAIPTTATTASNELATTLLVLNAIFKWRITRCSWSDRWINTIQETKLHSLVVLQHQQDQDFNGSQTIPKRLQLNNFVSYLFVFLQLAWTHLNCLFFICIAILQKEAKKSIFLSLICLSKI